MNMGTESATHPALPSSPEFFRALPLTLPLSSLRSLKQEKGCSETLFMPTDLLGRVVLSYPSGLLTLSKAPRSPPPEESPNTGGAGQQ